MRIRNAKGFALIDVLFVCGIIGILSLIAMPRLLLAKQAAGAASAIGSMRTINSAQLTFALTCGGGFYAPKLTVLGTPPGGSVTAFISPSLGQADSINQSGYSIQMNAAAFGAAPPTCNGLAAGQAGRGFKAAADPLTADNSRHFAVNANGQIYEDSSSMYAGIQETGEPPTGHVLR